MCNSSACQKPLDNIRTICRRTSEPVENEDFLTKLKETKKSSNLVVNSLRKFAENSSEKEAKIFNKSAAKIQSCSVYGAFRQVSENQNHKIGQALCKNKFCLVCQQVLSWKRRNKAMAFFEENKEVMKDFNCYHLVLTLRHNENHRNYDYVDELLTKFHNLRGSKSRKKSLVRWKEFVQGGYYSIEIKWGKNSPHIHIHAILMTHKSVKVHDLEFIKENWKGLTKDSNQVIVEPIFFLQDEYEEGATQFTRKDGSTAWKIEYDGEKHDVKYLQRAFMESLKYTIKTDEIFSSFNGDISQSKMNLIHSLLTKRHKLYNRFGCLVNSKKNRETFTGLEKLAMNFKDLDDVNTSDLSLVDMETGEVKEPHETRIIVTKFSNTKIYKRTKEYTLYKFIDDGKLADFAGHDVQGVQAKLSRTIKKE
jgi:hypothetical protein